MYSTQDTSALDTNVKTVKQAGRYGEFGENLTTGGIETNYALIGERWEIGTTVLEVSEPRIPCWRVGSSDE